MQVHNTMYETVREVFTSYLETKKLRKTSERYTVLKEVYSLTGHFEVESLYMRMKNKKLSVSRATVYNTLDLLVECNLVSRHAFDNTYYQYEKSYGSRQHNHIICVNCHQLTEFCDPRIQYIQDTVERLMPFEVVNHSLTFYASCTQKKCENHKK